MYLTLAWLALKKGFTSVISFVNAHQVLVAWVSSCLLVGWGGYHLSEARGRVELRALQAVVDKQIEANKALSDASVRVAEANKDSLAALGARIDKVTENYQAKLVEAMSATSKASPKERIQIVRVPIPGLTEPAQVMVQGNDVVCQRLPSQFTDSFNSIK